MAKEAQDTQAEVLDARRRAQDAEFDRLEAVQQLEKLKKQFQDSEQARLKSPRAPGPTGTSGTQTFLIGTPGMGGAQPDSAGGLQENEASQQTPLKSEESKEDQSPPKERSQSQGKRGMRIRRVSNSS